ncbi:hypothetical protein REMIM1_PF00243 (plasmid) [Rhizobium etli bv. mimosae str. Mim1]|nr:hypothetical protein REMIM1_PF00243 [Rhizobium etli bv. mimosae str. Mim1]
MKSGSASNLDPDRGLPEGKMAPHAFPRLAPSSRAVSAGFLLGMTIHTTSVDKAVDR